MTNKETINPRDLYFTIGDKSALPSPLWKRFIARLIDLFSYSIIGLIFIMIGYSMIAKAIPNIAGIATPDPGTSGTLIYYLKAFFAADLNLFYSWQLIVGTTITIFSAIFFGYIYPLFLNKKHIGQTLGKKALGIAPFFLNENSSKKTNIYISYIKREMFITPLIILSNIFILIIGFNPDSLAVFYNIFAQTANKDSTIFKNTWAFIKEIKGKGYINSYQEIFSMIKLVWVMFITIWLLIVLSTMAFNPKKRGIQDKFTDSVVIDLSTYGKLNLIEEPDEATILPRGEGFESKSMLVIENFAFKNSEKEEFDIEDLIDWNSVGLDVASEAKKENNLEQTKEIELVKEPQK